MKITLEKIHLIITNTIRFIVLLAMISTIANQNWSLLFIEVLTIFLTFLPRIIKEKYKIIIPIEFEILIILFIYASLVLGEMQRYYAKFPWWDLLLHSTSSIALGFVGFLMLYILYKGEKVEANPITIAIFSFSFALAIGTLWEIMEFTIDAFFGSNLQKSGIVDTMWDLIIASFGALFASALGFLYLKKEKVRIIEISLNKFKEKNPKLFK